MSLLQKLSAMEKSTSSSKRWNDLIFLGTATLGDECGHKLGCDFSQLLGLVSGGVLIVGDLLSVEAGDEVSTACWSPGVDVGVAP